MAHACDGMHATARRRRQGGSVRVAESDGNDAEWDADERPSERENGDDYGGRGHGAKKTTSGDDTHS